MRFLPKANPLYEKIPAQKVILPEVLEKLGKGGFTGYLGYTSHGFEAYCVFAKGNLICAISTEGDRDKSGFEAISLLFERVCKTNGEINVYRMTIDLAMCAHALTAGTKLFNGDEVRQVDVKSVLARMKAQSLNGVVHFYTENRFAMIFYREGQPIGFYHDNAQTIETSPEESRRVAALPGARLDVCTTKSIEDLMHYNLLQMVNLTKLWESAKSRSVSPEGPAGPLSSNSEEAPHDETKLQELVEDLKEIASAYLSKEGRELIEKQIKSAGGSAFFLDSVRTESFLHQIETISKTIDSDTRIDEMIDLMKSEIAGRLAV